MAIDLYNMCNKHIVNDSMIINTFILGGSCSSSMVNLFPSSKKNPISGSS